ncbi:hypothetical protein ACFXJ8_10550 [Nonomuraea sp. NPDC059194]|uniref:hypothetical protein n=1 Tax=Nonomuraea sp. NPDC059194 TaxID=3346764 RepID=UPI00369B3F4C
MPMPSGAPVLALALHPVALGPDLSPRPGSIWPPSWLPPVPTGTWVAVLLVTMSTLAGAWLARRNAQKISVWLAVACALMLITALTELLPDAWHEARESGTPLWLLGLAALLGFVVITLLTRGGCGHSGEEVRGGRHAPGLHRRVSGAVGGALFGGVGTAAALTAHRVIEGATLALAASVVVVAALMVHSASEGLALTALLDLARRRAAPWLALSCLSPALGVVLATLAPLPPQVVPLLLALITGVLLRTAVVGLRLADTAGGRLSRRHLLVAATAVLATTGLLTVARGELDGGPPPAPVAAPAPQIQAGGLLPIPQTLPSTKAPESGDARLRQALADGRLGLADLLRRTDRTTTETRVGPLLRALPGQSDGQVGRLLKRGGITAEAGLGELTRNQRRYLLRAFAPS